MKQVRLAGFAQTMQSVCLGCFSSWTVQRCLATSTCRDGDCTHYGVSGRILVIERFGGTGELLFGFIGSDIELVDYLDYH